MTTLIIGANGQIGRRLCEQAAQSGHAVRAMVRDEQQNTFFDSIGVETVMGDLTGDMDHVFEGCDQVVFTAGSGGATGLDHTLMVDLNGAMRAVDIAREHGIRRFLMVSTLHVDPLKGPEKLRPYLVAKRAADAYLQASGLEHVILRPGRLSDDPGTGHIETDQSRASTGDVSRDNVATAILTLLKRQTSAPEEIVLLEGDHPIDQVLG
ncbi:SDR family oxidoreductase [Kushneria marisflavi]|uniref:Epimerase n=1 Tax=Kushneria marisflavi TaxID=157779 RepID=A0A240ULK2_9GAMM|nr:SDR family oxidoreductase [Kushneria marisflavi]ART62006.1 epimerase [Kushneria marisflavi]RKD87066.1 putative NAD(P)-binding protein [Kushneria marisflavi]